MISNFELDCSSRLTPVSINAPLMLTIEYLSPKLGGSTLSFNRTDFFNETQILGCELVCNFGNTCSMSSIVSSPYALTEGGDKLLVS